MDLIVFLEEKNLEKFFNALKTAGYGPKVPVTKEQFDMFVDEPIAFEELYKKKKNVDAGGILVPLIGIDHLLKLKRMAGRNKDLDDIVQLKEIKRIQKI